MAKLINGILWLLNVLLGAGIVVFAFQNLIMAEPSHFLDEEGFKPVKDLRLESAQPLPIDISALRDLRNPIMPRTAEAANPVVNEIRGVTLVGTFPFEKDEEKSAILEITARKVQVVARLKRPIQDVEERDVPELLGWKLEEVHGDRVVLVSGGRKAELKMERIPLEGGPTAGGMMPGVVHPGGAVPRGPYAPGNYRSRLVSMNESQAVYEIDPKEMEYAMGNQEAILNDLSLSVYSDGGVKIENVPPGSIAASRGIMKGDVIRSVNGVSVSNLQEARNLLQDGTLQSSTELNLAINRNGRVINYVYRLQRRN